MIYSLMLLFFSGVVIFGLNIYLTDHLNHDPEWITPTSEIILQEIEKDPPPNPFRRPDPKRRILFRNLSELQREYIRQVRLNDLKEFREKSLISLIPITILSFLAGYYISGRFLSPINHLATRMNKIQTDELGKTIPKNSNDEVGALIDSFNLMSKRLKKSFDLQQRLVQDASHEIKTPLTVIKTSLDTVIDDKDSTKEELRESMQTALNGVKRLKDLTNDLMTLTTPFKVEEKSNVIKIVKDQVKELKGYAERNNVLIHFKTEVDTHDILINKMQIARAIYNIIHNAVKYSSQSVKKPEVNVEIIKSKKDKSKVEILISDNGKGVPEDIKDKIFERFYRGSKSCEGSGLGLSIAKDIIEFHGGEIKLLDTSRSLFMVRV